MSDTRELTSLNSKGEEVRIVVKSPTAKQMNEAQLVYNKALRAAIDSGAYLREGLNKHLVEQGFWDDDKAEREKAIYEEMADLEYELNKGGIKLSDAKDKALTLRGLRYELRELLTERLNHDALTAEGQAENKRFDYLVAVCSINELTQKPLFEDVDDYYSKQGEPYSADCAGNLGSLIYGLNADADADLTENKFLKRFNFIDDQYRLVNEDGDLVDREGNRVDELGRPINEEGQALRHDGRPLLQEGEDVETVDFLDDDVKPKRKRTRRKKVEKKDDEE